MYLNSQPTDSKSGIITIMSKSQLWMGNTEKFSEAFSHSSWIHLILLIQVIQYKIGKTQLILLYLNKELNFLNCRYTLHWTRPWKVLESPCDIYHREIGPEGFETFCDPLRQVDKVVNFCHAEPGLCWIPVVYRTTTHQGLA